MGEKHSIQSTITLKLISVNKQILAYAVAVFIVLGCTNSSTGFGITEADPSHILAEKAMMQIEKDFGIVDAQIIDVLQIAAFWNDSDEPLIPIGDDEFVFYEKWRDGKGFDTLYLKGSPPFYLEAIVSFLIQARDKDEVYVYTAFTWDKSEIIQDGRKYYTGLILDSLTSCSVERDYFKMPRNSADGLRYWRMEKRDLYESELYQRVDLYDFSWLDLKE